MEETLSLFMWGYQTHFRSTFQTRARKTLEAIGIDADPVVLLVGVRKPGDTGPNPVCIEPEFEKWPLSLFDGIEEAIEQAYKSDDDHNMFYGDQRSMEAKPENIRRSVVRGQVRECLKSFDEENEVVSFCGYARPVDRYYVVSVIQLPRTALDGLASLPEKRYLGRYRGSKNFVDNCLNEVLKEASLELEAAEPGRGHFENRRSALELARRAADAFMCTPVLATAREMGEEAFGLNLFKSLNELSALRYERSTGEGHLLLSNPDNPSLRYDLRFDTPVSFRDARWSRKLLQLTSDKLYLIANGGGIHGLGRLAEDQNSEHEVFKVDFISHYQWNMCFGKNIVIQSRYGEPALVKPPFSRERFVDNYKRILIGATETDADEAWRITEGMLQNDHGSMVVFAEDVETEVQRLSKQGMIVQPSRLTDELLAGTSKIDGSILLDKNGLCHAIGVILDGSANEACTPSRGSRYNSAVRYVNGLSPQRLAIVKSDDGSIDIIPLLRPRIDRKILEANILALEKADLDNYHMPRLYIDNHRFYLTQKECDRVNLALDRIDAIPQKGTYIRIVTQRLAPNPEMNSTYYL